MEMPSSVMTRSSRYPQLAEIWNKTGTALKDSGRYVEAIKCYDTAIDLDPKKAKLWYNRGLALQKLNREDEAHIAFVTAMELGYGSYI
ncbi:MAG: tetratricopeptide repeat protein [Methanotrichaceae archaeon]|jgi:Flp pilus assembly protein TadD